MLPNCWKQNMINYFTDELLQTPYWLGLIRSTGKCWNKQNKKPTYIRWHQLCMMYTGANGDLGGLLAIFCNITNSFFKLLCWGWKLDSGGIVGSCVGLFLMVCHDISVLVHNMLLTSVLSISIVFNLLSTVALGM